MCLKIPSNCIRNHLRVPKTHKNFLGKSPLLSQLYQSPQVPPPLKKFLKETLKNNVAFHLSCHKDNKTLSVLKHDTVEPQLADIFGTKPRLDK